MRRLLTLGVQLLVALAVFGYGVVKIGHVSGSAIFLGLSTFALLAGLQLLYGAGLALFVEPPAIEAAAATGRRRKELEREKLAVLKALKELAFDHALRKVSDADFEEIGGAYRARAIRVMRQLDDRQVDYAAFVEEELLRQKKQVERVPKVSPAEPRELVAICPSCLAKNDRDAVFCKKCATRIAREEVSS